MSREEVCIELTTCLPITRCAEGVNRKSRALRHHVILTNTARKLGNICLSRKT